MIAEYLIDVMFSMTKPGRVQFCITMLVVYHQVRCIAYVNMRDFRLELPFLTHALVVEILLAWIFSALLKELPRSAGIFECGRSVESKSKKF